MSSKRIIEEYKDLWNKPISNCGITVSLVDERSYQDWKVTMTGPKDTSYQGGIFILEIHFPDNYPNEPPEVCFLTPIYHLNINPKAPKNEGDEYDKLGHVSISTLNWWNPKYKIKEVLYNIYSLFYYQNPDSAYGIKRAKEYIEEREVFEVKAIFFTKKYALPNKSINYNIAKDWDFNLLI